MGAPTFPKKPYNMILTFDRHEGLFWPGPTPPFAPVPGFGWHFGAGLEVVSRALWTDMWNDDVLVDGHPICSVGNSTGLIGAHVHCLPASPGIIPFSLNLFMPLLFAFSSSTSFLAVGSVVAKNGPIAVTIPYVRYVGTNLACNDPIPLPTDVVIHTGSSVELGFTWGDLLAAAVRWAVAIAMGYATKAFGKLAGAAMRRGATWAGNRVSSVSTNAVAQRLGRALTNYGTNAGPGMMKTAYNRALRRAGLPQQFRQATPAGQNALDRFFGQSYLDDMLGLPGANRNGTFASVAKRLADKTPGVGTLLTRTGILDNPLSSGSGGLPDAIGGYVDSHAELVP